MLVLDENISEYEIWRLREAGVAVRVVGQDLAIKGVSDENIPRLLLKLKKPTFFTRDRDFWKATLRHPAYALVFLDVPEHEGEIAKYIRLFLRRSSFNTAAKRLGKVFQLQTSKITVWDGQISTSMPWK
jgi:hypothetical protein